ncbi:heme-binding protein [Sphingomonas sp. CGMCC 1.13654]|uniref:Heme-binding protein n=1 Tax=Sphingomonas chungangi TaxID=2683589 RepID=A0A838L7Y3_9SPHN|nr:heme-binding protein [Sphingomonas chungangi]MBA2934805.1 heme-binding protein [Sphingomonas chungangi]MVW58116.1 heme-binding protein [Sphingomonas chungangi]
MSLSLQSAQAIIAAALVEVEARGLAAASIVVTDPGGAIRAASRTDKAPAFGVDIALAKARTAAGFGRASIKTAAVFKDNPSATIGLNAAVGGSFLTIGGGVIVTEGDGTVIGAAAVAGGAPEVDHEIATAAVRAAGLATPD